MVLHVLLYLQTIKKLTCKLSATFMHRISHQTITKLKYVCNLEAQKRVRQTDNTIWNNPFPFLITT